MAIAALALLLALAPLRTSADLASFSVSTQQETGSFGSLDEAFSQTSHLGDVELVLLPGLQPFSVLVSVVLSQRIVVRGQGQSVQLGETMHVAEPGQLTLSNVLLQPSDNLIAAVVLDIRGSLIMEYSSVSGFHVPLIWLYGQAKLTKTLISHGNASTILMKAGSAVLDLISIEISQLSSSLLVFSAEESFQTSFNITIIDCVFIDNANWPIFAVSNTPGVLRIMSSSFGRNLGLGFNVTDSKLTLSLANCHFYDNYNSIMRIKSAVQTDFRITNCTFSNNSNSNVFSSSFSGLFIFEGYEVTAAFGLPPVETSAPVIVSAAVESLQAFCNISITNCVFVDSADLPIFAVSNTPGILRIMSSSFGRNLGLGFDIAGSGLTV